MSDTPYTPFTNSNHSLPSKTKPTTNMIQITQTQYDTIRASSTSAQSIFRSLNIKGWPTVFRTSDNRIYLRHS